MIPIPWETLPLHMKVSLTYLWCNYEGTVAIILISKNGDPICDRCQGALPRSTYETDCVVHVRDTDGRIRNTSEFREPA